MSGNSADSYSEGESEGEHVKEKTEGPITAAAPDPPPTLLYVRKGKTNGRVGRPKKLKNSQPPLPSPPPPSVHRRRGSGLQKSKLVIYNSHVILQFKQNGRMFVFFIIFSQVSEVSWSVPGQRRSEQQLRSTLPKTSQSSVSPPKRTASAACSSALCWSTTTVTGEPLSSTVTTAFSCSRKTSGVKMSCSHSLSADGGVGVTAALQPTEADSQMVPY